MTQSKLINDKFQFLSSDFHFPRFWNSQTELQKYPKIFRNIFKIYSDSQFRIFWKIPENSKFRKISKNFGKNREISENFGKKSVRIGLKKPGNLKIPGKFSEFRESWKTGNSGRKIDPGVLLINVFFGGIQISVKFGSRNSEFFPMFWIEKTRKNTEKLEKSTVAEVCIFGTIRYNLTPPEIPEFPRIWDLAKFCQENVKFRQISENLTNFAKFRSNFPPEFSDSERQNSRIPNFFPKKTESVGF